MCENYTVLKSIKDIQKSFDDLNQSRYVATEFDFYQNFAFCPLYHFYIKTTDIYKASLFFFLKIIRNLRKPTLINDK